MSVDVRVLQPEEWAAWRDLRLEALKDTPIGFLERYATAVDQTDAHWQQVPLRDGRQLLAWSDGRPAGMAGCFVRGVRPTVYAVFVAPGWRGKGVLDALVEWIEQWARQIPGSIDLALSVHEDNDPARAAYRRLGFTETGVTEPYELDVSRLELEMSRPL